MPYTLSLKSLIRLQRRQFSAGKKKRDLIGPIVLLVYFWVLEIVFYFLFKDKDVSVQTYTAVIVCLSMTVPDFLFKLIFIRFAGFDSFNQLINLGFHFLFGQIIGMVFHDKVPFLIEGQGRGLRPSERV